MTPEEIRADVERVLEELDRIPIVTTFREHEVAILLAAKKRWQNEALERAIEKVRGFIPEKWVKAIRALKEE